MEVRKRDEPYVSSHSERSVPPAVVAVGNFDGVHVGHQKIIRLTVEKAKSRGLKSIVYTFRPHPQVALKPDVYLPLLLTYDEKRELLEQQGVDQVIEERFDLEFAARSAEEFFREIILGRFNAETLVVGYDFAFGKGRQGHLQALEELCKSFGVVLIVVPPESFQGEVASSSRIRQYLAAAEIEAANRLLDRPFFYRGNVVQGEKRGRQLGFPTANLILNRSTGSKLILPFGVYATWAICGGKSFPSVTNVGVRPTFQSSPSISLMAPHDPLPVWVEVHLLDTEQELYGVSLEVQFMKYLRAEKKFPHLKSLQDQILLDIQNARRILNI